MIGSISTKIFCSSCASIRLCLLLLFFTTLSISSSGYVFWEYVSIFLFLSNLSHPATDCKNLNPGLNIRRIYNLSSIKCTNEGKQELKHRLDYYVLSSKFCSHIKLLLKIRILYMIEWNSSYRLLFLSAKKLQDEKMMTFLAPYKQNIYRYNFSCII